MYYPILGIAFFSIGLVISTFLGNFFVPDQPIQPEWAPLHLDALFKITGSITYVDENSIVLNPSTNRENMSDSIPQIRFTRASTTIFSIEKTYTDAVLTYATPAEYDRPLASGMEVMLLRERTEGDPFLARRIIVIKE